MLGNLRGRRARKSSKVGDSVLFEKFAAVQVEVEGVDCLLLAESDVQGVWM